MSKQSALAAATANTTVNAPVAPVAGVNPPSGESPTPQAVSPSQEANTTSTGNPAIDSDRFAQLAKREAAIQKEREAAKKEREALAAEKANYDKLRSEWSKFEETKKSDPIQAMKLAGFSDKDIFDFYVKAQEEQKLKDTPEERARQAALEEVNKLKTELQTKEEQSRAAADKAVIDNFKSSIGSTIKDSKGKYEYCEFYGPEAEVLAWSTVEEVYKTTGEAITAAEAVEMVEKYYEDRDKAMMSLKKRGQQPTGEPQTQDQPPKQAPPPPKTLSNKVTMTSASTVPIKETREQKKERLIKQIQQSGLRK